MAKGSKKVIIAALVGNGLIAVTKFIASFITGSSAMFSEGIHSVVDTGNQLLLLLGLKRSQKAADKEFPFGHGKEIYFWSFVVAITIFGVGSGISIYEGIISLSNPHPLEDVYINYIVLGLAFIFEAGAWFFAWREFRQSKGKMGYFEAVRKEKDPTTFVVLFEDSAAMLGLFVAFLGVALGQWTGNMIYDGISSIIIGVILAGTAAWLAYETKGLLIGESADQEVVNGIRKIVVSFSDIVRINETLTLHMGPDYILVNLNVDFKDDIESQILEQIVGKLTKKIKKNYPRVKRVFIEAE